MIELYGTGSARVRIGIPRVGSGFPKTAVIRTQSDDFIHSLVALSKAISMDRFHAREHWRSSWLFFQVCTPFSDLCVFNFYL